MIKHTVLMGGCEEVAVLFLWDVDTLRFVSWRLEALGQMSASDIRIRDESCIDRASEHTI